jgi:DNA-binding XRE family transcriptional regulator
MKLEEFGLAVRAVRHHLGLGLRGMAKRLNTSPATLCRIERGLPFDLETAIQIGPIVGMCPCCGKEWPKAERRLALQQDQRS